MFDSAISVLEWIGVAVFAVTGALVASRNQMDVIGFILLGTVTGIGGGTLRDLFLGLPLLWVQQPANLGVCIVVSVVVFFTAPFVQSRYQLILWFDAVGLALFAAVGAERALLAGASPLVAVTMGVITATFGGIIRDVLGQEQSIIFSKEIYVTAGLLASVVLVTLDDAGAGREVSLVAAVICGLGLRAGAILWGWSLPRYRPRPAQQ